MGRLTLASVIFGGKVFGRLVGEVLYEPSVAEGTISYKLDVELTGCVDQTVGLVNRFESGIFCLDGVDSGDLLSQPWCFYRLNRMLT